MAGLSLGSIPNGVCCQNMAPDPPA